MCVFGRKNSKQAENETIVFLLFFLVYKKLKAFAVKFFDFIKLDRLLFGLKYLDLSLRIFGG